MTAEEALVELEIELPYTRKISCPKHSDSDPSLHVYPEDKGFFCFSCGEGGDGWTLLSFFTGRPVGELMRERGHVSGPRPRSRWEQVGDIQGQSRARVDAWTVEMRRGPGLPFVAAVSERIDCMYPDLFSKHVDEDIPPFQLQQQLDDLVLFLEEERQRGALLHSMRHEQHPGAEPQATGEVQGQGPVPEVRQETTGQGHHILSAMPGGRGSHEGPPASTPTDLTTGTATRGATT